jgi:hypothetical protein
MNENFEYLTALSSMKENDFSENILVKLFTKMGYDRVDFNGGILEKGRDIILQKNMPLEPEPHTTLIQVKKINKKQNIKDAGKITNLTHQLYEAIDAGAIHIDGKKIRPNTIILAFPEQVSDRFMEQIKSLMNISERMNIKTLVYDGPKVIESIKTYAPEMLDSIVQKNTKIYDISDAENSNEELSIAVNSYSKKRIQDIYMSLDFFVGSINSNFLLTSNIHFRKEKLKFNQGNWAFFKKKYYEIEKKFGIKISSKPPEEIESEFKKYKELYETEKNKENIKYAEIIQKEIKTVKENISELQSTLKKQLNQSRFNIIHDKNEITSIITFLEMNGHEADPSNLPKVSVSNRIVDNIKTKLEENIDLNKKLRDINRKIISRPEMEVKISTNEILDRIETYKDRHAKLSKDVKRNIQTFLLNTEESLSFINEITSESSVLYEIIEVSFSGYSKERFEVKPEDILGSGYDIAVYGAAGAGKTTTLSNFAISKSKIEKNSVIYVPLNRVVEKHNKIYKSITRKDPDKLNNDERLTIDPNNAIFICILLSKGISFNSQTLELLKKEITKEKTIIIDGLDEAYDSINGILQSINNFKRSHKCQIIISSRDCVKYLDDIDFLGITLLPFTKEQLLQFVNKWFGDSDSKNPLLDRIENTELFREISSPLLATIACDLVDKGFNIPVCEHEIYEQRFSLLTGEYDKSKGVTRQKFSRKILMQAAMALAYEMHTKKVRELSDIDCIQTISRKLRLENRQSDATKLFSEMISPSNIIYFDKLSKKYSFGHFRFQEYLVSEQISLDRNIDVIDLISQTWWAGALCLFSQKTDITFIFEQIIQEGGDVERSNNILRQMIKASPKEKRTGLYDLFKLTEKTRSDYRIIDYSEHSNLDISEFGIYIPDELNRYSSDSNY